MKTTKSCRCFGTTCFGTTCFGETCFGKNRWAGRPGAVESWRNCWSLVPGARRRRKNTLQGNRIWMA